MRRRLKLNVRGALRFGVLLAGTVWLWWFFRSYFLFTAMLLIVISAAASVILLYKNKDKISAQAWLPAERAGRGAPFSFEIRIENESRFLGVGGVLTYRWGNVFTQGYEAKTERLWITPREGVCISRSLESRFAGRIEAELTRFVIFDLFHLVEYDGCSRRAAWTTVYPVRRTEEEDELSCIVEGFPAGEEIKKRGTEYQPDYEVREYAAGDELKNIHWKLTAKRDWLMVRERLAAGREKMNVLLPLGSDKEENDRLMDAFSGVCALLIEKGYPVHGFWLGYGYALQSGYAAERGELEGMIAEILSADGSRQPEEAVRQIALLHPGEAYILIKAGTYEGVYVRN